MSEGRPSLVGVVLSCLDRALNIVGESGRQVVYEALEGRYGVSRQEIVDHPDFFLKITKLYLGSASEAVEKEALFWIRQDTGVEADSLSEAFDALKREFEKQPINRQLTEPSEETRPSGAEWTLESQTGVAGIDTGTGSFKYTARLSFGKAPAAQKDDPQSKEALEAYLRSIVEKHAHHEMED